MFVTAFAISLLPSTARANPSQTPPTKSLNNTASTTQVYMVAGLSTSTITYDSFSVTTDTKFDGLTVAVQVSASGTPPTLKMRLEDSPDCKDWYPRSVAITTATTTILTGSFNEYQIPIATTTSMLGGSSNASSTVIGITPRVHQEVTVDTPMRCTRAIFYNPPGSGNFALWAQLIPFKEKY